jgi:hypothetical protein
MHTFPPAVPLSDPVRCPTTEQRAVFVNALKSGDAVMHAFPHSSQPEMLGKDGLEAALLLGVSIASELGLAHPTVSNKLELPCTTRCVCL